MVGKKVQIDLRDMDYISWQRNIRGDIDILETLIHMTEDISPEFDYKLNQLFKVIKDKEKNPINPGNKKILIFTAFANTAEYLYENIAPRAKEIGLNTALITGSIEGKTTIPNFRAEMNHILTCFSPISKDRDVVYPDDTETDIEILIATDCILEGQNLQDCDFCINYDIHWNPVRIIQRFGRIDRIGSKNKVIQLVNFWPDLTLDEYINLKDRVETRMKISVMTATGDDDLINHLQPKDILDEMRHLAKGKKEPDKKLCKEFNRATKDGRQMEKVSQLLEEAIESIIEAKNEEDIESFFSAGTTTFQSGGFSGLDDFELIDFLVVM